jgi:hypothetical protein
MAVLDSIAIEIQATIAGVLILLIITLLEIIDLRRARKQHRESLHALIHNAAPAPNKRLISPFSLILQFIFGFSAFALFVFGMMYLIISGMPVLAGIAGVSAFIAAIMPFIFWSADRRAGKETAEAIKQAEQHRQEPVLRQKASEAPSTQAEPPAPAPAIKETASVSAEPAIHEPAPIPQPQPPAEPEPATHAETKSSPCRKPDPAYVFPQDSMLRRHFITHLAATIKPYEPARPTDSILRRHYDAAVAAQASATSPSPRPQKTSAPEIAKPPLKGTQQAKIPEDSMLRRHFMTTLQSKIESRLALPPRPTDSMLHRHYEGMRENLVAAELKKYLEG